MIMARKSGLGTLGMLLALIGSILLIIFGLALIVSTVVSGFEDVLAQLNYRIIDLSTYGGDNVVYGILAIIFGVIVFYTWKNGNVKSGDDLLVYGIVYVVLYLVLGGGLGGVLVLLGGVLLIIDYFI